MAKLSKMTVEVDVHGMAEFSEACRVVDEQGATIATQKDRIDELEYAAQEVLDSWVPAKPLEYQFSAQEWDAYQQLVAVMKERQK